MQAEHHGNHLLPASVSQVASGVSPGGNMEGKETRSGHAGHRRADVRGVPARCHRDRPGLIYFPMLILGPIGERIIG